MKTSKRIGWSRWLLSAAVGGSLLSAGCGAEFEPASTIADVRILAVQGAPTFAAPGESVSLKLLAVDPRARKLQVAWTTCVNPSSSLVNACLAQFAAERAAGHSPAVTIGEALDDFRLQVPPDALTSLPASAWPNATVGVVTVVCPGTITARDAVPPSSETSPFACVDESGAELPPEGFVVSVKRIAVRARDRNNNPAIATITWNGEAWPEGDSRAISACNNDPVQYRDCAGGEQAAVAVTAAAAASEVGTDEFGTPFTEQVIAQHYAAQGVFEDDARRADAPGTHWVARSTARGTDQTLWFTLRDDRGGVTWTSRTVHVN